MTRYFILLIFLLSAKFTFSQENVLSKKDTADKIWVDGRKCYVINVQRKETIFSISQRFGISQEEIIEVNPDLKNGLKVKMRLFVPIKAKAGKKEEPIEEKKNEEVKLKPVYNIALLLPVSAWKNFIVDTTAIPDSSGIVLIGRESETNLQFYEGAEMALDSLCKNDFKVHLHLIDTENDSVKTNAILHSDEMKNIDAIIDNGSLPLVKVINKYSVLNDVDYFSFAPNSSDVIRNNPHGVSLLPSSLLQCTEMGGLMAKKFIDANCMVITTAVSKEDSRSAAFKYGWMNTNPESKVKSIDCSKSETDVVIAALKKDRNNLIFVPSSDEDFVSSLFSVLVDTTDDFSITIVGLPTWQYFQSIDPSLMQTMKVYAFNAANINEEDESTVAFRKHFRKLYSTEPLDAALQGYDAIMIVCSQLKLHKEKIIEQLKEKTFKGLYSTYTFPKFVENTVHENQFIIVQKYENYELVEIKIDN